ncbi:MAG: hypothetical protein COU22_03665 [Candidatus Komeilibacteria bacterium CG10_big_fil_rev_8_21_14_0_10_41_13]|uniref:Uncharacterized protein n=1 Tax=Candidatus Komeilibacteria bacterium CG10_big_fil_rev_8_21_14_0_10_41_13 TaxID=1974476 RepID=A0A2M6WBJ1_9BACT|nr:MAG: hypothetical protein COU22_03665 [Candidatus Komeilibacteria bacterium CG10_big_fil_rev_8_21_14_0_10_41_13]
MNQDNRGQFSLKLIQKCPVCNNDYHEGQIEILEENIRGFLAYMTCGFCSSSIIVQVNTMPHGLVGNAILTDLSSVEVMDYAQHDQVLGDNVLEMHQLMGKANTFLARLRNID